MRIARGRLAMLVGFGSHHVEGAQQHHAADRGRSIP